MILSVFEEVLSNLDSHGEEKFGEDWIDLVRERLQALEAAYRILTQPDRQPIDYSELPTQAAYVFAYGMPRAGFTYERLKAHRMSLGRPLFARPNIQVTSIGGGPASELVGLLQYFRDPDVGEKVTSISYTIVDHDGEWEHVANLVADCVPEDIDVVMNFRRCNLLDKQDIRQIDLSDDDLTIFSYIISELKAFTGTYPVVENVKTILTTLDVGSFVFYMDSESYKFYSLFNSCRNVPRLIRREDIEGNTKFDPGPYSGVFASFCVDLDRDPRLDGNIVSKLLEKE